ncbi:peptide deformylase, mitochondrial-like [Aricia agestis]|uniref:peptide deformylase, mitochondrial-like n=1 Tax=Aricia agestis TaxID=91739 RepID=UPI001C202FB5|nr:peptide deformylase, mitochondrial-like [Aricia agestis]
MGVLRNGLNWYAKISRCGAKPIPPYEHVVQIGDPILRRVCEPVPQNEIKNEKTIKIINKLHYVVDKYNSLGMSAPQIGINSRIFVMKYTAKQVACVPPEIIRQRDIKIVPFTVFINPTLKVVDYKKVIYPEACESVKSFVADVARYNEVEIKGYNAEGEAVSERFKGWSARIAQHEMDHLDGKLYTDIMDRKSLSCSCWEEVNLSRGKINIPFTPE